jgi:DNA primase
MSFREALLHLAERAHVPVPRSVRDQADVSVRASLYEVLGWAEKQFHEFLLQSPQALRARDYLRSRGISRESIERYRLGFHPDSWDWVLRRGANQFAIEQLLEARLVSARENNAGHHDFVGLIDRVQFPIRDSRGRCVAFGGRILPDSPRADSAKYINSPESELFNKSRLLYGMDVARDAIARTGEVIVTEGYTDCILCHQHGIGNVVGTLGTALTELHVAELKRFARRVILVYDGDAAGQRATERSLPRFLAQEVDLRILTLPDNLDPADFLVSRGRQAFTDLLSRAVEAWDYKLRTTIARYGLDSIDSRHRVLTEMLDVVAAVPVTHSSGMSSAWQNRKNVILGTLSQRLGIPEATIRSSLAALMTERSRRGMRTASSDPNDSRIRSGGVNRAAGNPVPQGRPVRKVSPREQVERELLEVILTLPETIGKVVAAISPSDVQTPALRSLFELCLAVSNAGHSPSYHTVTSTLEDLELKRLAAELDDEAQQSEVNEALLAGVLQYLQLHRPALARSSASGGAASAAAAPSLFSDSSFSASDTEASTTGSSLAGAVPPEDLVRLQAAIDAARQRQSLSSPSS